MSIRQASGLESKPLDVDRSSVWTELLALRALVPVCDGHPMAGKAHVSELVQRLVAVAVELGAPEPGPCDLCAGELAIGGVAQHQDCERRAG
jgi:hypothetical protein